MPGKHSARERISPYWSSLESLSLSASRRGRSFSLVRSFAARLFRRAVKARAISIFDSCSTKAAHRAYIYTYTRVVNAIRTCGTCCRKGFSPGAHQVVSFSPFLSLRRTQTQRGIVRTRANFVSRFSPVKSFVYHGLQWWASGSLAIIRHRFDILLVVWCPQFAIIRNHPNSLDNCSI